MDAAGEPHRQAAEADVERHVAVDRLADLERDAEVLDQIRGDALAVGADDRGRAAERRDHDVVDVAVGVRVGGDAVRVPEQVGAGRPELGEDELACELGEVVRVDVPVAVLVSRRRQLSSEVGERHDDVVVEGADDVRARVERVADQRDVDVLRGAVEALLEIGEDLRQRLQEQRPVERLAVDQRLRASAAMSRRRSGRSRGCTRS